LHKCHAPARSLLRLGPRSWVFAPAFLESKLANLAVCPVSTAFGPLRHCMAFRGAGGTQEGSGCTLRFYFVFKARQFFFEGSTITFLISRTALRGFFAILTTHRRNFFSTLKGLLRPGALASIGLMEYLACVDEIAELLYYAGCRLVAPSPHAAPTCPT
jgi:hypothetical protein